MINNAEVAAGENKENALPEICILYDFVLVPTNKRRSETEIERGRGRVNERPVHIVDAGSTGFKPTTTTRTNSHTA